MEITRPCISFKTGLVKAGFQASFCLNTAQRLLQDFPGFDEIKVSDRIGLLKTYGKITMMLFEDGAVTIKPVGTSEEGFSLLKDIGTLLTGAARCELTAGNTVESCDRSPCPMGCRFLKIGRIHIVDEIEE
jgi:hypothetical protein